MSSAQRFVSRVLSLSIAFALAATVAAQGNVSGVWIFNVQTDAGSGTPTITLAQDGEKLTGQYSGQLGEAPITGTIKGADIMFSFNGDLQGQSFTVTYKGTVSGNTMKGSVDLGGQAQGTFTAEKKK